ncbi:MAG: hypothetical protein LBN33_02680 [Desulfovibrio sp.]|jgi:NADPH-dependent 2,4-dienoyl-CoA reductase/sulfur reductase-like enzyme|nr:hypothetical protein [Desulfovibrio sp.]
MLVVVIGAVATDPKATARFKRLRPDAGVILIDRSERISYGACNIPYYLSGEVDAIEILSSIPARTRICTISSKTRFANASLKYPPIALWLLSAIQGYAPLRLSLT